MLITILCISVVMLSVLVIGIPFIWLLHGQRPLSEQQWIEVPFLGIAAIILFLQNPVYLDLPVRYTTPFLWAAALAGWLWMYRAKQITPSVATIPWAPFGVTLAVYLLQGIGIIIVGAKFYLGRAWVDQYNYTMMAQFLTDQRFSTSLQELGHQPYMLTGMALKGDRIGQSILQGFFAVSSFQDAKTLFEPAILLGPALTVLAIYLLGLRFGLHKRYALATAAAAGLLPALTAIHLESFFSQMLSVPFLLLFPLLLDRLVEQPNWQRFSTSAVLAAAFTSIYTEFWILLMALIVVSVIVAAAFVPHTKRLFGYYVALVLAPFVLNPFFARAVWVIFTRVDLEVLTSLYPWAQSIEGLGRVWLGDLAATPGPSQIAIRAYAIALTGLGYYGLAQMCIAQLFSGRKIWNDREQRRKLAFTLCVLMLALLPIMIFARDEQHPYQFYKLLLSVSPLLVLGVALAFQPSATDLPSDLPAEPVIQKRAAIYTALTIGVVFTGAIVGTTSMVIQSTSLQPAPRYNGYLMTAPDMRQLQDQLEALHDQKLFFYTNDTEANTGFLNGWIAYFARNNQLWIGNQRMSPSDHGDIRETKPITDFETLPVDALVLNNLTPQLASFVPKRSTLWSNNTYQLWQPTDPYWVIPLKVENKNGLEQVEGESFFWMGQGDTVVQIVASKAGMLSLNATFQLGSSISDTTRRRLRVITNTGYIQQSTITNSTKSILIPVKAGMNTITLHMLDKPNIKQQPNGDARPLLLGVKGLTMHLDQVPTLIESIENLNGIELSNQQPFFWLGKGDTTVKVRTTSAGQLRMSATFVIGPSAPEIHDRHMLVTTDHGYKQTFTLAGGEQSIVLPVEAGATNITLHMLDQPSVRKQPSGDVRPLLLGVLGLQVELEH